MKTYGFLAIGILLCPGCGTGPSSVEIQNKSGFGVSSVNVLVGGNSLKVDRIAPGAKATLTYDPQEDSGLRVNFQSDQDSKPRSCSVDVYVTTADQEEFVVTLTADGGCKLVKAAQGQ